MSKVNKLLNEEQLNATIQRMADEIASRYESQKDAVAIVGIQRRGVSFGQRLKERIDEKWGGSVDLGVLDITLYRDDLSAPGSQPEVRNTRIDFDVQNRIILLTDDVLFTGRTIRSALNAIVDFGRPQKIDLIVLVDRGNRELPIQADAAGLSIETTPDQTVQVYFDEYDGQNCVMLQTDA
ncbi:bifunctional pyr operon transcriptional regulator/uracil phosphoribosyltransferase PyrR [Candidatus Sumerlaeota bacterium]|nr:bifunctional pyr operon transcriptional regulator/uracil phosphoribosyltransferase PyrR [Candidatus Sumerlaeota bacterium]